MKSQQLHAAIQYILGQKSFSCLKQIAKEQLVDTNGAGDAFVGGFLSQIVLGKVRNLLQGDYDLRHNLFFWKRDV